MSHPNPMIDLQSAPVPAAALPASDITPAANKRDMHDEKEAGIIDGETMVGSAVDLHLVEGDEPTEEEYLTLRKIPAKMPWVGIAMCAIELAERASYYGCQGVFANFVRGPLPPGGNGAGAVAPGEAGKDQSAGALGMGSVVATASGQTFTFLAYIIPIMGGIIADTKWGRFKTICIGTVIGAVAHFLLIIPAIPAVIASGNAFAPYMISIIILAFASGLIKPCLAVLLCDQSPVKRPTLSTTSKGERVILDPQATVQRYLLIFYWCINVGGLFAIATTYSERYVGFWLAFLEPGIVFMIMPLVLWWAYKRLYKAPPQGSVVWETILVFRQLARRGGFFGAFRRKGADQWWNNAKPSVIAEQEGSLDTEKIFWDDQFVDEIRQSINACLVFATIPIFFLANLGVGNQLNSMSASMTLNHVPNDIINNFNPLSIIIATPIITFGVYPFFEKIGYPLRPITRMSIGFLFTTAQMIFAAVIQTRIYATSPCGSYATDCELGVSPVSIGWQIPLYILPAIGEIFLIVTSYEIAYTRAPARMKGLVYALNLASSAVSAAIGLALSDVIKDPNLVIPYYVLAGATFLCAIMLPFVFKHLNEPAKEFANVERMAGKQQPKALQPAAVEEVKR